VGNAFDLLSPILPEGALEGIGGHDKLGVGKGTGFDLIGHQFWHRVH
jgi:hypothetical protein